MYQGYQDYKEIAITMSHEAYKYMVGMKGIGSKEKLIAYINETYGLLGNVVDIAIEND